jgi:hypothetical protein
MQEKERGGKFVPLWCTDFETKRSEVSFPFHAQKREKAR